MAQTCAVETTAPPGTRWRECVLVLGLLVVLFGIGITVTTYAQSDADLTRRVAVLEAIGAPERLARLEARLDSIQQLMTGVLVVLVGQVLVSVVRPGKRA